jgi:CDP-glucose 4,6-dehydratase
MQNNFWKNKKVLITGHTGFKGSWLTLILSNYGAKIAGYALNPISKPNFFDDLKLTKYLRKDIRDDILNLNKLKTVIKKYQPEVIFHLAAQSSVLVSYNTPKETIGTNVIGTINILEAIRNNKSVKSLIIATTDKVYLNLEKKKSFKENDSLGGHDIYSASKAACEIVVQSYTKSFFLNTNCNIATVRSGNCIGGGDWTKDRIVKDCAESFLNNKKLTIRHPNATRPWQHVMEPLFGYIKLSEKLFKNRKYVGSWNFGPNIRSNLKVLDVAKFGKKFLNSKSNIIIKKSKLYESTNLSLNSSKSQKYLQWKTHLDAKLALRLTLDWYKYHKINHSIEKVIYFTLNQIKNYIKLLKKK